ncbi:MAG: LLM class F420-dependent oxidoreductase [Nocardioides sp.]
MTTATDHVALGVAIELTDEDAGIVDVATAVEAAGLESLFVTEHSHVPVARQDLVEDAFLTRHRRLLDQFSVLAAAAAVTTRIRLGTAVCVVPQHDPILLAKQVATLDHLSGGRFMLGAAAGWLVEELQNLGVDPSTRWELMGEQIAAMKEIWTHDEAEYHGRYVDFAPIWAWPKPVQAPHPPVLVGGAGPRTLRVVAEQGDGWLRLVDDLTELDAALAELDRLCANLGRPRPPVSACFGELDEELLHGCLRRGVVRCVVMAPTGSLDELREFLDRCSRLRLAPPGR